MVVQVVKKGAAQLFGFQGFKRYCTAWDAVALQNVFRAGRDQNDADTKLYLPQAARKGKAVLVRLGEHDVKQDQVAAAGAWRSALEQLLRRCVFRQSRRPGPRPAGSLRSNRGSRNGPGVHRHKLQCGTNRSFLPPLKWKTFPELFRASVSYNVKAETNAGTG